MNAVAVSAMLHCLAGCAAGEVTGMVVGIALGLSNSATVRLGAVDQFWLLGGGPTTCRPYFS